MNQLFRLHRSVLDVPLRLHAFRRASNVTSSAAVTSDSSGGTGIVTLTLNNSSSRNALSISTLNQLDKLLLEVSLLESTRVIIINAVGPVFCSGHNLKELVNQSQTESDFKTLFDTCSKVMTRISSLPQPVVAKVNGVATAAGCQLVAASYANSETTKFATPGVNIGLFCSTPAVALSRSVPFRKKVMEMLLTGDFIDCDTAVSLGLINESLCGIESLNEKVSEISSTICSKSATSIKMGKQTFYKQLELPLEDAYKYAGVTMTSNMLHGDAKEGISAFLEKRPPIFET